MKGTVAPFLGSDIGDGFCKVPAMAVKVLSVVLALSIGLVLRFGEDDGTVRPRARAMTLCIFDANLHDVTIVGHHIAFSNGEAAVARFHLDAVIGNAKTDREAKSLGQPIRGCAGVGINENRNYSAGRDGSVESHRETLSLTTNKNLAAPVPVTTPLSSLQPLTPVEEISAGCPRNTVFIVRGVHAQSHHFSRKVTSISI